MNKFENMNKYLVYQPKVNLSTFEIIGLEALIRFRDKKSNKLLDTQEVINSIDNIENYFSLTNYVFKKVILDINKLEKLNINISIAINISAKEMCSDNFYNCIKYSSKYYKKALDKIELEIIEKDEVDNIEVMKERIYWLRELGVSIAIDDLGAGFNKIDMIEKYDVDLIKIDKNIVRNYKNKEDELRYIIEMARKKNIKLLAEGIESEEELNKFKKLGVEFGQGYYFYKPIEFEKIANIINFFKEKEIYKYNKNVDFLYC